MDATAPESAIDTTQPPLFRGQIDHGSEPVARILDAAERCLSRSGYGGMSVRTVAKEAGVSKSLLHYHFQSKQHLFMEVQTRVYNRLALRVAEVAAPVASGKQRTRVALRTLLDALRARESLPVEAEIWARALGNDELRARAAAVHDYLHGVIVQTLERILGADRSWLPFPVEVAADLLLGALTGLGLQAAIEEDAQRTDRALRGLTQLVELAIDGIGEPEHE